MISRNVFAFPRFVRTARWRPIAPVLWAASALLLTCAQARTPQPAESQPAEQGTALLIIDVQEFYFPGGALPLHNPEVASLNCKRLLEKFRSDDRTVVHVGHNASKGAAFHADVMPGKGEKVIMKSEVNAFKGTDLLDYLKGKGIRRLVICGMQTHMCVEAAVRAASDFGFECVLVQDACATRDVKFQDKIIGADDVQASTLATLDGAYAKVVDTDTLLKTD